MAIRGFALAALKAGISVAMMPTIANPAVVVAKVARSSGFTGKSLIFGA